MTGVYEQGGIWQDGIFENIFVKQNGVWKFQNLHYFPTCITVYDKGWTADARPAPGVIADFPPDALPSEVYAIYPKAYVPAFHDWNPVTGEPPAASIAATQVRETSYVAPPASALEAAPAQAKGLIQQVKDHNEIENLENAYGYYLDKNLWRDLADLFAVNGSMELVQRGVYSGRERIRPFLFEVFGSERPVEGRLGDHIQMQPVITLNPDRQSAAVRSRMMQQLSFSGRSSMGAAVYENTVVKEEGKWKYSATHAYNAWTASYYRGMGKSPRHPRAWPQ